MKNAEKILEVLERYHGDGEQAVRGESDPSVLYAFSDIRENLLEWYPFEKGAELLQIGSDAGALTGLFLKKGLRVTVFETDEQEIAVGEKRFAQCTDLSYVREVADDEGSGAFDYVVLVGTLDRAPEWFSSLHPYEELVQKAKEYVKPGGVLFLAAANRMGVRYFSGAARMERGFTKAELGRMLDKPIGDTAFAGVAAKNGSTTWYYPMPEYRLPVMLYSDAYLPVRGEFSNLDVSYDAPRYQMMSEEAALNICCEEGQFANFTSSYLVVWKKFCTPLQV